MGLTLDFTVELRFSELSEFWGIYHGTTQKDKQVKGQLRKLEDRWRVGEIFEKITSGKLDGTQD